MAAITLAVASLVVAAGAAYMQHKAQVKAAREQKKANEIQKAQADVSAQADRRQQVRQDRIKRAQIAQSAQNSGVSMSSGEFGAGGALSTQIGNNIGSISEGQNTANGVSARLQSAQNASNQAATFAQVGQLASSTFSFAASTPKVQKIINNVFS
jgi:hypothetical protein